MNIRRLLYSLVFLFAFVGCTSDGLFDGELSGGTNGSENSVLLSGEVIGTRYSVDYSNSSKSERVNTKELLYESQQLNFKRWKILDQYVCQNHQALGSYDAEVKTVEDYIKGRITKLDGLIKGQ